MHREYHRWFSPSLHRDMQLLVFGHAGARVLAFPASRHPFYDWENRGLVESLRWHLDNGHLQLFCVDQVDSESWYAQGQHPAQRVQRHVQYDRYLTAEVVPFTLRENVNPFLIATGPSFGAYHAVNFAFRHPQLVARVLGMSGLYDVKAFADGHGFGDIYFNSPCDFLANEKDPDRLAALRRMNIILAVGRQDRLLSSNERLSQLLWEKGIWNALRIWDGQAHDWPFWSKMLALYLSGND